MTLDAGIITMEVAANGDPRAEPTGGVRDDTMICEAIQTLYRYNTWANLRILDTTAHLSPEQFVTVVRALILFATRWCTR